MMGKEYTFDREFELKHFYSNESLDEHIAKILRNGGRVESVYRALGEPWEYEEEIVPFCVWSSCPKAPREQVKGSPIAASNIDVFIEGVS